VKILSAILASLIVLAACAARPAPQPTLAAAPSAGPAASATRGTAPSGQSAAQADPDADLHNYARSMGYKPAERNGKQAWCRLEPTLGSHFETRSCVSDAVLADLRHKAVENQQEMIHEYRPNCVGSMCTN
jgi:hypothetical protein